MLNKFHKNQKIIHAESKKVYHIVLEPNPLRRLEATNETFYSYASVNYMMEGGDRRVWYRSKKSMEEAGKFTIYSNPTKKKA